MSQSWMARHQSLMLGKTTSARIIRFLEHQTANQQGDVNPGRGLYRTYVTSQGAPEPF